jgi:hypothetical protein
MLADAGTSKMTFRRLSLQGVGGNPVQQILVQPLLIGMLAAVSLILHH